ncbi:MAG: alpha/beta fold hydrolase [Candidatus Binatia bacterium]
MRGRRRTLLACVLAAVVAPLPAFADERVDITATDGVQLIGHLSGTHGPGVVLVPGSDGEARTLEGPASTLAARGFRVLRFDLRGRGDSDGPADSTAIERDVEGAFRYMIGRKIRPTYLVSAASSAAAAMLVATRVSAAAVVLVGTPPALPSPSAGVRIETISGELTGTGVPDVLARLLQRREQPPGDDAENR